MSVLTDNDFLLHALQLSYLRNVLPNHVPLSASSTAAAAPYAIVTFPPPADLAASNPYLALSGAADPLRWPELATPSSGRTSPPLAPRLASDAFPPRGLRYSQTIGKAVATAGIKVDGSRPRAAMGKGRPRPSRSPPRRSSPSHLPPPVVIHSPTRTPRDSPARPAHDPSGTSQSKASASPLPSRTRFAQHPSSSLSSASGIAPSSSASPGDFPPRTLADADALGQSLESSGISLFTAPTAPQQQRRGSGSDASSSGSSGAESDFPAGPVPVPQQGPAPTLDAPPLTTGFQLPVGFRPRERRRVNIRPGEVLAPASALPAKAPSLSSSADSDFADRASPVPVPTQAEVSQADPPVFQLPPGFRPRERKRVNIRPGQVIARAPAAGHAPPSPSLSSSADSDFAGRMPPPPAAAAAAHVEQLKPTNSELSISTGAAGAGSSGASDAGGGLPSPLTPLTPAPGGAPVAALAQAEAEEVKEAHPVSRVFQLPPGLRVRERRRVNIRPGAVLAPALDPLPPPPPPPQPPPLELRAEPVLPPPAPRRRSSRPPSPAAPDTPYFPPRAAYFAPSAPSGTSAAARPDRQSALSALLAAHAAAEAAASSTRGGRGRGLANPFSTLYAACVSRAPEALPLRLFFFPRGRRAPADRPVEVRVKRDVSVEEVLGVGLWAYWEEGREPPLEGVEEEDAREGRETAKWALRIVEDGEVDEDFPALDRTRNVSAFAFTEFAVVRAEDEQIQDNLAKQASIVRRPSRILASAAPAAPTPGQPAAGASPVDLQPCGGGSALAVPVLLRIALPPVTAAEGVIALQRGEEVGVQTTVKVPSDMYLADVLELVVRKRGLRTSARKWALVVRLQDGDLVVPLDRTVESLGEQHDLELVPRAQVGPGGVRKLVGAGERNQDPSQSIFTPSQHLATTAQPAYQTTAAAAAAGTAGAAPYLHFSVLRKLPMSLGGRHARVIAIDGDYLHFMPPEGNLPAPMRGRTTSFHISAVHACKISRRSATSFKIVVHTKRGVDKRYDFEAESPERAREIVETVRRVIEFYRTERGR